MPELKTTNPYIDYMLEQLAKGDQFSVGWQYFSSEDNPGGAFFWWDAHADEYAELPLRSTIIPALIAQFPTRVKVLYASPTTLPFPLDSTRLEFATFFGVPNPNFEGTPLPGGAWMNLFNPGVYYPETDSFMSNLQDHLEPNLYSQFFTTPGYVPLGVVGFIIGQVALQAAAGMIAIRPDYYIAYLLIPGKCDCCNCCSDLAGGEGMADCQDLVDAVLSVNTTLRDLKTDLDSMKIDIGKIKVSLCKNEAASDNLAKIVESLDQRLLHRSAQLDFSSKSLISQSLASDNIAAKLDQVLYPITGIKSPTTGVDSSPDIDAGLDLDTIHQSIDHSSCTSDGGGGSSGGGSET